jgi:hypothetical protein
MPRKRSTTKSTGGGGFGFADKVAARFLVQMLSRDFPLEPEYGCAVGLDWEVSQNGWHLDDLLLHLQGDEGDVYCAISVKSNAQLNSNGFQGDFPKDAWDQWSATSANPFRREKDFLGLAVSHLANTVSTAWHGILEQMKMPADRLAKVLATSAGSSDIQRGIFSSIVKARPSQLPPNNSEAASLLRRIRVFHFDSENDNDAIRSCSELTVENTASMGKLLWRRLRELAREHRESGGHVSVLELIRILRPDFNLRDYPDYEADWRKVDNLSKDNRSVKNTVGSEIRLQISKQLQTLRDGLSGSMAVAILGESGVGKSALVAHFLGLEPTSTRVLWLKARQLSKSSQIELAQHFRFNHDLPTLIDHSPQTRAFAVLDGIEQFDGDTLDRAVELIRTLAKSENRNWQLIITCQPLRWPEYKRCLVSAGISALLEISFKGPEFSEIYEATKHISGLASILMRKELRPVLSNLAVLDQVVRAHEARPFADARPWVGETEVIDWIWDQWTKSDSKQLVRSRLLRGLAEKDGEHLNREMSLEDIPTDQLEALSEMKERGLLHVDKHESSVQFAHDIMADWARYRALKAFGGDACSRVRLHARTPRWGRAIRLYAQSLAEQGDGLDEWSSARTLIDGEDAESRIASDLFFDSIILATNVAYLLELIWEDLLSDNGKPLSRLLRRLQLVATIPDPRYETIKDVELREVALSSWQFRLPNPIYWISLLTVLERHSEDVGKAACIEAAKACGLYLNTIPFGIPGRREAAALALVLARVVQAQVIAGVYFLDEVDRPVYEALLRAASEYPDEVGQIALELCHRRSPSREVLARVAAIDDDHGKRRKRSAADNPDEEVRRAVPGMYMHFERPLPPPWPDGPSERVPDTFIAVVMDPHTLTPLIMVRPQIAKEVLLAVCLEEPSTEDRSNYLSRMEYSGLSSWRGGYPAMYFKSPFIAFLEHSQEEALETIIRLTNFVTDRWIEDTFGPVSDIQKANRASWEFVIDGHVKLWNGDGQVFNWHRDMRMNGAAVECALMALEKWFYDAIEAGKDIGPAIRKIFAQSTSLSLAGVLTTVGLRFPALFCGALRPLLSCPFIFEAQSHSSTQEVFYGSQIGMMSWADKGEDAFQKVREWHGLPHRKQHLRYVAQYLMFHDSATMEFLKKQTVRWNERWAEVISNPKIDTESLEFLIVQLNGDSYTRTKLPDGKIQFEIQLPEKLQQIADATAEQLETTGLLLGLPSRARELIVGKQSLDSTQIAEFIAKLRRIDALSADSENVRQYRPSAIIGGIAAVLTNHRQWLRDNPDSEEWCVRRLRAAVPESQPEGSFDVPESITDTHSETFRAEAAVVLLCEREDEWVRRAVFDGVTGFFYESTLHTMRAAYRMRAGLGRKFNELVNLVNLWAAVRHGANCGQHGRVEKALTPYRDALFHRYQSGRLSGDLVPLERAEMLGGRLADRALRKSPYGEVRRKSKQQRVSPRKGKDRKVYRPDRDLDMTVLQKGFGFLEELGKASSEEKRQLFLYFEPLFRLELRSLPVIEDDEDWELDKTPYDFDRWIIGFAAAFTAKSESREDAYALYSPIISLSTHARYWVEEFLHAWFRWGLPLSSTEMDFTQRWREIAEFALGAASWNQEGRRRRFYLEYLANELVGITGIPTMRVAGEEFRGVIQSMAATYALWCDVWLESPVCAAHFAYFLSTASGQVLLPMGIPRLALAIRAYSQHDWQERNLLDGLSTAVSACWRFIRSSIRSDTNIREAFETILSELCARHDARALQLRVEVAAA